MEVMQMHNQIEATDKRCYQRMLMHILLHIPACVSPRSTSSNEETTGRATSSYLIKLICEVVILCYVYSIITLGNCDNLNTFIPYILLLP